MRIKNGGEFKKKKKKKNKKKKKKKKEELKWAKLNGIYKRRKIARGKHYLPGIETSKLEKRKCELSKQNK